MTPVFGLLAALACASSIRAADFSYSGHQPVGDRLGIGGQPIDRPVVAQARRHNPHTSARRGERSIVIASALTGAINLLCLAATRLRRLSVVSVPTALYPVIILTLAHVALDKQWNRKQLCGLFSAAVAMVPISLG